MVDARGDPAHKPPSPPRGEQCRVDVSVTRVLTRIETLADHHAQRGHPRWIPPEDLESRADEVFGVTSGPVLANLDGHEHVKLQDPAASVRSLPEELRSRAESTAISIVYLQGGRRPDETMIWCVPGGADGTLVATRGADESRSKGS